jgi:hypothetical protein
MLQIFFFFFFFEIAIFQQKGPAGCQNISDFFWFFYFSLWPVAKFD